MLSDNRYESGLPLSRALTDLYRQNRGVRDSHADFDYLDYREEDSGRLS